MAAGRAWSPIVQALRRAGEVIAPKIEAAAENAIEKRIAKSRAARRKKK
jgi:hypothetical protein